MYFEEIASTWPFTSRANSFSNCCRSMSLSAASIRSKLSSGNLESIGTIRSTLITASTRSPPTKPYWSENALGGRRSRSRFSSKSSPKPPRAFGGRRICWSSPSPLACSASRLVARPTSPSCWWIAFVCFDACSSRRSTFVSSSARRRSTISFIACSRPSISEFRTVSRRSRTRGSQAASAAPPATTTSRIKRAVMSRRTLVRASDGTYPTQRSRAARAALEKQVRSSLRVLALRVLLRGALPLFLSHLLRALSALRGHGFLLLVHALALHRAVAGHTARGLLPAAQQLVEPTHCGLLALCIREYPKWPPPTPDPDDLSALRI